MSTDLAARPRSANRRWRAPEKRGVDLAVERPSSTVGRSLRGRDWLGNRALGPSTFASAIFRPPTAWNWSTQADLVAVDVEAVLLELQPVVVARVVAAAPDDFAAQVLDLLDPRVGAHDQLAAGDEVDGLPEVHPAVAARAIAVRREVVAADELDVAASAPRRAPRARRCACRTRRRARALPGTRLGNDVQKRQMRARPIGEGDLIHCVRSKSPGHAGSR